MEKGSIAFFVTFFLKSQEKLSLKHWIKYIYMYYFIYIIWLQPWIYCTLGSDLKDCHWQFIYFTNAKMVICSLFSHSCSKAVSSSFVVAINQPFILFMAVLTAQDTVETHSSSQREVFNFHEKCSYFEIHAQLHPYIYPAFNPLGLSLALKESTIKDISETG